MHAFKVEKIEKILDYIFVYPLSKYFRMNQFLSVLEYLININKRILFIIIETYKYNKASPNMIIFTKMFIDAFGSE